MMIGNIVETISTVVPGRFVSSGIPPKGREAWRIEAP